jgi:hypothetical protein
MYTHMKLRSAIGYIFFDMLVCNSSSSRGGEGEGAAV